MLKILKISLILLVIYAFNISDCNCDYKGGVSEVKWNDKLNIFEPSVIQLGKLGINVEYFFCKKKRNKIEIQGSIFNQETLINQNFELKNNILVLKINKKGNILDTLCIVNKKGRFSFKTSIKKQNYLVFFEKENKKGIKYDFKKFRKW